MARALPRGTVTFLFTGIADSTRLWDDASTDIAQALRVHDDIVRGAIERHGGYVFGADGDGFGAAFSTATDATSAAIESQEQLRDETIVPFQIRMGVHTGEAVERDRTYVGNDVNSAARLMLLAHGGQVLVSDASEVLLRDRVALRPLGEHRFRGSRGRMSVYQLDVDGLPTPNSSWPWRVAPSPAEQPRSGIARPTQAESRLSTDPHLVPKSFG